jgi:hypothetical protein
MHTSAATALHHASGPNHTREVETVSVIRANNCKRKKKVVESIDEGGKSKSPRLHLPRQC